MADLTRRQVGTALLAGTGALMATRLEAAALPAAWTAAERIPLWPNGTPAGGHAPPPRDPAMPPAFITDVAEPELRLFRPRPGTGNGRALLAVPGGAYHFVSIQNEGVEVAERFCALGYTVFVLVYRLPGEGWQDRADVPLQDAQRAIRLIRAAAPRLGYEADRIVALGFSAGGHLAASLLTGADERVYAPRDATDALSARPACGLLLYPVIALTAPDWHQLSAEKLLGPVRPPALVARRSPDRTVSAATPPIFLAHAIDDPAVPSSNSRRMFDALRAAGRPAELHLFEHGGHGFGLGPAGTPQGLWSALAAAWIDQTLAGAAA